MPFLLVVEHIEYSAAFCNANIFFLFLVSSMCFTGQENLDSAGCSPRCENRPNFLLCNKILALFEKNVLLPVLFPNWHSAFLHES